MAAPSPPPGRIVVIVGQGWDPTSCVGADSDKFLAQRYPNRPGSRYPLRPRGSRCYSRSAGGLRGRVQGLDPDSRGALEAGEMGTSSTSARTRVFNGGSGRHADYTALVNLHAMFAHLNLALARAAPKAIIPFAKYDTLPPGTKVKDEYYIEATGHLNRADDALRASGAGVEDEPVTLMIGKVILHFAKGNPAAAHPLVERLLARQPNNLLGLTAQARLLFARRSHEAAYATYQKLLRLNPEMSPDPRIGLGLCAWVLGDRTKAELAWKRALDRDPESWTSLLLLGLASLNTAREPATSTEDRHKLEKEGAESVSFAFKLNKYSPAAALALSSIMGQGGKLPTASKLAERAIQYSDNKRHSVLANAERGRLGFVAGDLVDAGMFIAAAKAEEVGGFNMMAELTLGQIAIKSGNLREALNFIEKLAVKLNGKGPLEYTVLHASLLAYPHPGMGAEEVLKNRTTARNMLTELHTLVTAAETNEDLAKLRKVGEDSDIFVELAGLWQEESLEKSISAYQTAVSIKAAASSAATEEKPLDLTEVRMSNNLGALFQLQGNVETAERMFQESLQKLAADDGKTAEVLKTVLAYNLARAYEEGGEVIKAAQWYRDVLRQHPEHMESKVRLALLAATAGRNFDAHTLLKESLKSDESNLPLRSFYTTFLISLGSYKEALTFTSQTIKFDRNDSFTFCALGWIHFTLGREAKSSQEVAERPKQYLRSAEAYERALTLDPHCAIAAQGLAIALAEDTLSPKPAGGVSVAEELKARARTAGLALGVFSRIKDSLAEGPVMVNIGHCYFSRGEEERAIEAYGAALTALKGKNVTVLLYLARAWYAFANSKENFSAMNQALSYCQKAMHLQPSDRAILYNIAMIQQKAAEMLLGLDPSRRTLEELNIALGQAQQAANTFRVLADDRSGALPYDAELADQRARYGDSLLRKAPEQINKQEIYEGETQARVEEARRARKEEQDRIQAAEAARRLEIETKAAELAEKRRLAREEARLWQEQMNAQNAEEESKRAANLEKRKRKKEVGDSGDEGEGRRKRKGGGKKKKIKTEEESSEAEGEFSDSREGSGVVVDEEEKRREKAKDTLKMLKARKSKKKVEDPDEDEKGDVAPTARKSGKQFKSKAYISDSEDEDEIGNAGDETVAETERGDEDVAMEEAAVRDEDGDEED
ncbi:RNA polymerase-associated protein CTR9, partial [Tremellales sp. Uapishka_1]